MDIKVFPNPTTSIFNVQATANESASLINTNVFDMQGRLIQTIKISPNENVTLGATLKPGVYLLEMNHVGEKKVVRIVKY